MVKLNCSRKASDGYTLMETVTAIFVLSIILSSFTLGASTLFRQAGTHLLTFRSLHLRYSLHKSFTRSIERISPPFWAQQNIDISPSGLRASIPYLDGTGDSRLLIDLQDDSLVIREETKEDSRALFRITGIHNASLSPAVNSISGGVDGIILTAAIESAGSGELTEQITVPAYFSSRTAGPVTENR